MHGMAEVEALGAHWVVRSGEVGEEGVEDVGRCGAGRRTGAGRRGAERGGREVGGGGGDG